MPVKPNTPPDPDAGEMLRASVEQAAVATDAVRERLAELLAAGPLNADQTDALSGLIFHTAYAARNGSASLLLRLPEHGGDLPTPLSVRVNGDHALSDTSRMLPIDRVTLHGKDGPAVARILGDGPRAHSAALRLAACANVLAGMDTRQLLDSRNSLLLAQGDGAFALLRYEKLEALRAARTALRNLHGAGLRVVKTVDDLEGWIAALKESHDALLALDTLDARDAQADGEADRESDPAAPGGGRP